MESNTEGPLKGIQVVEFAGMGPAPFCGMLLADLGADIIRVDRQEGLGTMDDPVIGRGRRSIALNLKDAADREVALKLVERSHVLLEGFRPGVMERLGLGPVDCHRRNRGLVYVRLTGWGQDAGAVTGKAGHDINYIAAAGVLGAIGDEKPVVPLNLLGDYAGGSLLACIGLLAGLRAAERGENEIVIDSGMRAGATYLMSYQYELAAKGLWKDARRANLLDGGTPFYDTYACADGAWMAVGAIEEKFYRDLLAGLGLEDLLGKVDRHDPGQFAFIRKCLADRFASQPRDFWVERFSGLDACVSPILSMAELVGTPALRERVEGMPEPLPAPGFSGPSSLPRPAPVVGGHTEEIRAALGAGADFRAMESQNI